MEDTKSNKKLKKFRPTKRKVIDSSESETDADMNKQGGVDVTRRQSSRIFQKECKPKFSLPSRDVIWDNIPSQETLPRLKHLTPKKTVNNFTKVYNAYNFDDYEDTSDEISSDESSELDDEDDKTNQTAHRIQNYHKRIIQMSSSDDEKISQTTERLKEAISKEANNLVSHIQSCSNEDSDDLANKIPSSQESDIQDSEDSNIFSSSQRKKHKKLAALASDDSEDSSIAKTNQSDSKSCHDNSNLDSDSSSSSSGAKKCRSEKLKERRSSLFKQFQEAKQRKHSKLNITN